MKTDRSALEARTAARRLGKTLLDFVYPSRCIVCGAWDQPVVCRGCAATIERMPTESCSECPRPRSSGPCPTCSAAKARWGGWSFEKAGAAYVFDGALRRLVHEMKYRDQTQLADYLGDLAVEGIVDTFPGSIDWIVPMPGDPWRMMRRGGNPVDSMAARIALALDLPMLPPGSFQRRGAPAQMGKSPEARRAAPLCFQWNPTRAPSIRGASLLLFDDVFTTGTSVHAAASSLIEAGAGSVKVWTLAAGG